MLRSLKHQTNLRSITLNSKGVDRIILETTYHQRTDFNTLTPPRFGKNFSCKLWTRNLGQKYSLLRKI